MFFLKEPTKLYFDNTIPEGELRQFLTYRDRSVDFTLQKFRKNHWLRAQMGQQEWQERLDELTSQRTKCLLFEDEFGKYTHAGLAHDLEQRFHQKTVNKVQYPERKMIPWDISPPPLRKYQEEAKERLLAGRHASVSIGTGLGKSYILMHLVKYLGLKAVVMAPTISIAEQLHYDFSKFLGRKYVGMYGDGKKQAKKLVTVAIGASLTRLEKGSEDYELLSKAQVFIADESHMTPAATLTHVCLNLLKDAPYRFFFSGTQMRGDGAELLLKGIIGPIVYNMSVKDGVEQGFLARPIFKFYRVTSNSPFQDSDALKMTRKHLYYNDNVNALVGKITNAVVGGLGHQVLILISEIEQFAKLLPYFKYEAGLAHGGVTAANKGKLPAQYHKSDPRKLVEDFNNRKLKILVGTSCISTGTDIRPPKTLFYLNGGKSPIELGQGMGRGTRLFEDGDYKKISFNFVDFDVVNCDITHKHALERISMCNEIMGPVRELES